MPVHSTLWYLERFRLLDALTKSQLSLVEQGTRMLEVRRGQRIYLPGDTSDQIFLVKAGVIKVAAIEPGDCEVILAFLHPGDIFGELAIVDDGVRDHLAQAHEDALLCAVSRDLLLRMARESPELGYRITKLMGRRMKQFRTRVEDLLCKSAAGRVAHTLVELATEHGVTDTQGTILPFRLTQRDLGNLVGVSRETVNAVLQDLRQKGLVEVNRERIRLRNVQSLRAFR